MATISTTVIVNMALSALGIAPVLSIDDNTKPAKVMNVWFDPTRDEVIRAAAWTFARTRATLAQLTETPAFTWDYQYQLPVKPKCLRVLKLIEGYDYVIESDKLLTNFETASILFLQRVTDPTKYDSMFVPALAYRLAFNACFDLTGSLDRTAQVNKAYEHILNIASGMSLNEHHRTPDYNNSWIQAGRVGFLTDMPPYGYGGSPEDISG